MRIYKPEATLIVGKIALLDHAIRRPDDSLTIEEHRRYHGVTYPTAWKDLTTTESLGLLDRTKSGKKAVFRPTAKVRALADRE